MIRAPATTFAFIGVIVFACGGSADSSKADPARCSTEKSFAPKCECLNAKADQPCAMDCRGAASCEMLCEEFQSSCSSVCGDRCNARCALGPTCDTQCGAECIVTCNAEKACTGACGAFCNYTCENAPDCTVTVGDASQVRCTSVASCNVTCTGKCIVRCDRENTKCAATCPDGVEKKECAEGWACGTDC